MNPEDVLNMDEFVEVGENVVPVSGTIDDPTLMRVLLIILFICLWVVMLFPILYDVVLTTVHLAVTFTPKPNNFEDLRYQTIHYEYFMDNIYDPYNYDEFKAIEFSSWTVWNILQLCLSGAVFVFQIYILLAFIIDGISGWGFYYDPS